VPFYPTPPASQGRSPVLGCIFALSLFLNIAAVIVLGLVCLISFFGFSASSDAGLTLIERHHSGNTSSKDKVAIITLDGAIMEGLLRYPHQQIEQAGKDSAVKAVVLRINSPGGSITGSEDLYQKLTELKKGNLGEKRQAKKLVVSMAGLAASGGYYAAMPADYLIGERCTMTGSIGVFAAFPQAEELLKWARFKMEVIKQGEIKDSGSPFHDMNDKEKAVWQSLINQAYNQFIEVVETGRPDLKGKLLEKFPYAVAPLRENGQEIKQSGPANMTRYRADGGLFTATEARDLGLIDEVGSLEDAINKARSLAKIPSDCNVVQYERLKTLSEQLLGIRKDPPPAGQLSPEMIERALTPRLWYLAPGAELAGLAAAARE
jgi:protease-4